MLEHADAAEAAGTCKMFCQLQATSDVQMMQDAIANGKASQAQQLLQQGLDVTAQDSEVACSLVFITVENAVIICVHFKRHVARHYVHEDMQGKTALHYIVSMDDKSARSILLSKKLSAWVDFTEELLDAKADVNARDSKVWQRWQLVAYDFRVAYAISRTILSLSAHSASGLQGMTPLHYAALKGNADFVRLLLASGADVSAECHMVSHLLLA